MPGKALFKPEWGIYDLTGGGNIKSVYGGPSDYIKFEPYLQNYKVKKLKIQPNVCVDSDRKDLIKLYKKVDKQIHNNIPDLDILKEIVGILNINYSDEWLLRIQIFNLTKYEDAQWISENNQFLRQYKKGTDIHHTIIRAMQS